MQHGRVHLGDTPAANDAYLKQDPRFLPCAGRLGPDDGGPRFRARRFLSDHAVIRPRWEKSCFTGDEIVNLWIYVADEAGFFLYMAKEKREKL